MEGGRDPSHKLNSIGFHSSLLDDTICYGTYYHLKWFWVTFYKHLLENMDKIPKPVSYGLTLYICTY